MTKPDNELILWFDRLRNTDVPIVGGKNASLGEMIHAGMPVPQGFAITAYAYEKFILIRLYNCCLFYNSKL